MLSSCVDVCVGDSSFIYFEAKKKSEEEEEEKNTRSVHVSLLFKRQHIRSSLSIIRLVADVCVIVPSFFLLSDFSLFSIFHFDPVWMLHRRNFFYLKINLKTKKSTLDGDCI